MVCGIWCAIAFTKSNEGKGKWMLLWFSEAASLVDEDVSHH